MPMKKILILGANGQIARVATRLFLERDDVELTLFLRRATRLRDAASRPRVRVVEGDVLDRHQLAAAVPGHDVVYANLAGAMARQAANIVSAMQDAGVRRLIFISSMGIYDEVPGPRHGSILDPYRDSVKVIEASGLDYTILRPAWLDDQDVVAYGTTRKGEPFKSAEATVSRRSVADLVVKLALNPDMEVGSSLGVHRA